MGRWCLCDSVCTFRDVERQVLCLCTLCRICSQHVLQSHSRFAFCTLTYAMGQKTTSSAHAPCKHSQLISFVPGEPSWLCSVSASPTEHPRVSPAPIHATRGRTGWNWSGCRDLMNSPRTSTTSSATGGLPSLTLRSRSQPTSWTCTGAPVKSQTCRGLWRSCWRCLWLKDLRSIWWLLTQRKFWTAPHFGLSSAEL